MKKKILCMLCALLLVCGFVLPVGAIELHEDHYYATDVTAKTSSTTAYRGSTVTVIVSLANSISVSSGEIRLQYDDSILTVSNAIWYFPHAETSFDNETEIGAFSFPLETEIGGDIFSVTFMIYEEAELQDTEILCELSLTDASGSSLEVTNFAGTLSILCNHVTEKEWSTDENAHWYVCTLCRQKDREEAHQYDDTCDNSCDVCGYVRTDAHDYYEEWRFNETAHWRECRICNGQTEAVAHTPGDPATDYTDQTCTECGYVIEAAFDHVHTYNTEWTVDEESHCYECTECGEKKDLSAHSFENACDPDCATCGYTRTVPHSFTTVWTTTEDYHWHECTICGQRKDENVHIPGAPATEQAGQLCITCGYQIAPPLAHVHNFSTSWMSDSHNHWNLCISCGGTANITPHVYDNSCDAICNTCSYVRTVTHRYGSDWASDRSAHWHECSVCGLNADQSVHVYNNACDASCNVCGYTRSVTHKYPTEMSKDKTEHWYRCSVCGERKDVAPHSYTNACDTACNECGYERTTTHSYSTEWFTDGDNHWHICRVCGETDSKEAHVPGEGPTETEDQLCTVCGHLLKVALGHTHSFAGEWHWDNNAHWHVCICGETESKANHTWSAGTVVKEPTVEEEGETHYHCTACGFERTETVERLPDPARFWWVWLVGGILLVGIVAGIIGYVIWRKKSFFVRIN